MPAQQEHFVSNLLVFVCLLCVRLSCVQWWAAAVAAVRGLAQQPTDSVLELVCGWPSGSNFLLAESSFAPFTWSCKRRCSFKCCWWCYCSSLAPSTCLRQWKEWPISASNAMATSANDQACWMRTKIHSFVCLLCFEIRLLASSGAN